MVTGDLEWLTEQIEIALARMRAKNDREREMILRSNELIAKARELLSQPVPTTWPLKAHSVDPVVLRPRTKFEME